MHLLVSLVHVTKLIMSNYHFCQVPVSLRDFWVGLHCVHQVVAMRVNSFKKKLI